jgi:hypothetical protein
MQNLDLKKKINGTGVGRTQWEAESKVEDKGR